MTNRIFDALFSIADQEVRKAIASPVVPLQSTASDTPMAAREVAGAIVQKAAPVVEHLANREPWYQSRVTWGAIITAIGSIAAIFGYSYTAEAQLATLNVVMFVAPPLVGAALTLWGRYVARKPLGT